jgi:hypothetical protein
VYVTVTRVGGGTRTGTFEPEQLLIERTITAEQILGNLIGE